MLSVIAAQNRNSPAQVVIIIFFIFYFILLLLLLLLKLLLLHVRGVTAQTTTTAAVFCSASRIRRPTSLNVSWTWTALCIISNTRKYDRGLSHFLRNALHWLHVVDRETLRSRLCVQIYGWMFNFGYPHALNWWCVGLHLTVLWVACGISVVRTHANAQTLLH